MDVPRTCNAAMIPTTEVLHSTAVMSPNAKEYFKGPPNVSDALYVRSVRVCNTRGVHTWNDRRGGGQEEGRRNGGNDSTLMLVAIVGSFAVAPVISARGRGECQ